MPYTAALLLDRLSPTKLLLSLLVVGGVFGGSWYLADIPTAFMALGVLAVAVGLPLLVILAVRQLRVGRRRKNLSNDLVRDLGRKFFEGVERFRQSDRDLYSVPWYVLAGEPGAGKTEAIRHANICPKGLNDPHQGEGGTVNMDWWFARGAVLLDTAGRLMFEASPEWREFLRLLKRNRPACPINGMILAIPAVSLLTDTADAITDKAGKIAQQFDVVQRELGVRFPVYVIITKSDLLPGFREFFQSVSDPAEQNQMLGWSNPSGLDEPFHPELVDQHLAMVRDRLKRKRMAQLIDPKAVDDHSSRRLDQVDALYALPDNLGRMASRMRLYLETIFMPSEWSMKPLFLRGIYFTSALCEGAALNVDMAETLGVPLDELKPEQRAYASRSFFLKDLFFEKVFPESGLVTSSNNISRQLQRRRLVLTGGGLAMAALVAIAAGMGYWGLQTTIGERRTFWEGVLGAQTATGIEVLAMPAPAMPANLVEDEPVRTLHTRNVSLATTPLNVPKVFEPWEWVGADITASSKAAHGQVFARGVLAPLVEEAARKLAAEDAGFDNGPGFLVLRNLVRIAALADGHEDGEPVDLAALEAFVVSPEDRPRLAEMLGGHSVEEAARLTLGENAQPWASLYGESASQARQDRFGSLFIEALESYGKYARGRAIQRVQQIAALVTQLEVLEEVEIRLNEAAGAVPTQDITPASVAALRKAFVTHLPPTEEAHAAVTGLLSPLAGDLRTRDLAQMLVGVRVDKETILAQYEQLRMATGLESEGDQPQTLTGRAHATILRHAHAVRSQAEGEEQTLLGDPQRLARLYNEFLAYDEADSQNRAAARIDLYRRIARLQTQQASADRPAADFLDGSALLAAVDRMLDEAVPATEIRNLSGSGISMDARAGRTAQVAQTICGGSGRHAVWTAMLDGMDAAITRRIELQAAEPLPGLPLTAAGEAWVVEPAFRPEVGPAVFGAWHALARSWPAARPGVMAADAIEATLTERDALMAVRRDEFIAYWTTTVPRQLAVQVDAGTSQQALAAMADPATVNQRLAAIAEAGRDALQGLHASADDTQRSVLAEHVALYANALATLGDGGWQKYFTDLVGHWEDLGSTPMQRRLRALQLTGDQFSKLVLRTDPNRPDLAQGYWSDWTYAMLAQLERESAAAWRHHYGAIIERAGFPLVRGNGVKELQPKDISDLRLLLEGLTPTRFPEVEDKRLAQAVLVLRNGDSDEQERAWLGRLAAVADALIPANGQREMNCRVSLVRATVNNIKQLRFTAGQRPAPLHWLGHLDTLATVPYFTPGITLAFHYDDTVRQTTRPAGSWGLFRLLLEDADAVAAVPDAPGAFDLTFNVEGRDQVVLRFEFERPVEGVVDPRRDWPAAPARQPPPRRAR